MRKTASKKLTCLLLSILMALGSASTAVMAAEGEPAAEKKSALQEKNLEKNVKAERIRQKRRGGLHIMERNDAKSANNIPER